MTIEHVTGVVDSAVAVLLDEVRTQGYEGNALVHVVILNDTFENVPDTGEFTPLRQERVFNADVQVWQLVESGEWRADSQFEGVTHDSAFLLMLRAKVQSQPAVLHRWTRR